MHATIRRRPRLLAALPAALLLFAALAAPSPAEEAAAAYPAPWPGVAVVEAWPGIAFDGPIGLVRGPSGTDDLYVWEQAGLVKRLPRPQADASPAEAAVYLDLRDRVFPRVQGGLLGLAFHPRHAQNGRLFATYLRGEMGRGFEWVLAEYRAANGRVDPGTERILLVAPKSTAMHNAGWIAFAADGTLYASVGDNAKQKEAILTAQNPQSLLGKILRIDVDRQEAGLPYAIPADNPWATYTGGQVRREIFAYGMRNPWQFCFDDDGTLWTAEPGAKGPGTHEWVVRLRKGANHGWPFREGSRPLEPIPESLAGQEFVPPVFEYERGPEPDLTAAWGGVFYRGQRIPSLRGRYVFGDYPRGAVWTLDVTGAKGTDWRTLARLKGVCRIGEDARGELYFVSLDQGKVFTLVASE